jgi:DNA-binding response OmpR family regulator
MKKKILLIEDETGISMAVKDELEFEGYEVKLVEDGLLGLESLLSDKPDLVVLDLMLPGKKELLRPSSC